MCWKLLEIVIHFYYSVATGYAQLEIPCSYIAQIIIEQFCPIRHKSIVTPLNGTEKSRISISQIIFSLEDFRKNIIDEFLLRRAG